MILDILKNILSEDGKYKKYFHSASDTFHVFQVTEKDFDSNGEFIEAKLEFKEFLESIGVNASTYIYKDRIILPLFILNQTSKQYYNNTIKTQLENDINSSDFIRQNYSKISKFIINSVFNIINNIKKGNLKSEYADILFERAKKYKVKIEKLKNRNTEEIIKSLYKGDISALFKDAISMIYSYYDKEFNIATDWSEEWKGNLSLFLGVILLNSPYGLAGFLEKEKTNIELKIGVKIVSGKTSDYQIQFSEDVDIIEDSEVLDDSVSSMEAYGDTVMEMEKRAGRIDPYKLMDKYILSICSNVVDMEEVDGVYQVKLDEYGTPTVLDPNKVKQILLSFLCNSLSLNDLDENGDYKSSSMFYKLRNTEVLYPWIYQLINEHTDVLGFKNNGLFIFNDDNLNAKLYSTFNLYFQHYFIITTLGQQDYDTNNWNNDYKIIIQNKKDISRKLMEILNMIWINPLKLWGNVFREKDSRYYNKEAYLVSKEFINLLNAIHKAPERNYKKMDFNDSEQVKNYIFNEIDFLNIILKELNFPLVPNTMKSYIYNEYIRTKDYNEILPYMNAIFKIFSNTEDIFLSGLSLRKIDVIRYIYKISEFLSLLIKEEYVATSLVSNKQYYSYVQKSSLNTLFLNLTNPNRKEFLQYIRDKFFKYVNIFGSQEALDEDYTLYNDRVLSATGKLMLLKYDENGELTGFNKIATYIYNYILRDFVRADEKERQTFHIYENLGLSGVQYSDKSKLYYFSSLLISYYNSGTQFSYFRVPTLSDKPREMYIKFYKKLKVRGEGDSIRSQLIDADGVLSYIENNYLNEFCLQFISEIYRMANVRNRNNNYNNDITNYDNIDNSTKFSLLTFLNDILDKEDILEYAEETIFDYYNDILGYESTINNIKRDLKLDCKNLKDLIEVLIETVIEEGKIDIFKYQKNIESFIYIGLLNSIIHYQNYLLDNNIINKNTYKFVDDRLNKLFFALDDSGEHNITIDLENEKLIQSLIDRMPEEAEGIITNNLNILYEALDSGWLSSKELKEVEMNDLEDLIESLNNKKSYIYNRQLVFAVTTNFFLEDLLFSSSLLPLLVSDPSYFENHIDLCKRLAAINASGNVPLYNKKSKESDGKLRYIIINDNVSPSLESMSVLQKIQNKYDKNSEQYTMLDRMIKELSKCKETDGEGIIGIDSFRKKLLALGKFGEESVEIFDKIKNKDYNGLSDVVSNWNTLKPVIYTFLDTDNSENGIIPTMKTPFYVKYSEYLILLTDMLAMVEDVENPLRVYYDIMEESNKDTSNGIDGFLFTSAVKVGANHIIDNGNTTDAQEYRKKLKEKIYNKDGEFTEFVQVVDIEDWKEQQNNPRHLNAQTHSMGSQSRILCISNLNPNDSIEVIYEDRKTKTVSEIYKEYKQLLQAYIELNSEEFRDNFKINSGSLLMKKIEISNFLKKRLAENGDVSLLESVELDPETNDFKMPIGSPLTASKTTQLLFSAIKNSVYNVDLWGGMATQVSSFGHDLHVRYKDKEGNLLESSREFFDRKRNENPSIYGGYDYNNLLSLVSSKDEKEKEIFLQFRMDYYNEVMKNMNSVAYWECKVSAYDRKLIEKLQKIGVIDKEGNILDESYIQENCPELLKMIGIRIPTEAKYSMIPLKIVGFLDSTSGENIILPKDVVVIMGSDFDIDKMYIQRFKPTIVNSENEGDFELKYEYNSISREGINNKINAIQYAILTSPSSLEEHIYMNNFEEQRRLAEFIIERDNLNQSVSLLSSFSSVATQLNTQNSNMMGNELVGPCAVNSLAHSIVRLGSYKENVTNKDNGFMITLTSPDNLSFKLVYIDEKSNKKKIHTFGRFNANKGYTKFEVDPKYEVFTGKLLSLVLGSNKPCSTDNAKYNYWGYLNVNLNTIYFVLTAQRLGIPLEVIIAFTTCSVMQDLLKEYNEEYINKNSEHFIKFSTFVTNKVDKIKEQKNNIDPINYTSDPIIVNGKDGLLNNPLVSDENEESILFFIDKIFRISFCIKHINTITQRNSKGHCGPNFITYDTDQKSLKEAIDYIKTDELSNNSIYNALSDSIPLLFSTAVSNLKELLFQGLLYMENTDLYKESLEFLNESVKWKMYPNELREFNRFIFNYIMIAPYSELENDKLVFNTIVPNDDNRKSNILKYGPYFIYSFKETIGENRYLILDYLKFTKFGMGMNVGAISDPTFINNLKESWWQLHQDYPEVSNVLIEYGIHKYGLTFAYNSYMSLSTNIFLKDEEWNDKYKKAFNKIEIKDINTTPYKIAALEFLISKQKYRSKLHVYTDYDGNRLISRILSEAPIIFKDRYKATEYYGEMIYPDIYVLKNLDYIPINSDFIPKNIDEFNRQYTMVSQKWHGISEYNCQYFRTTEDMTEGYIPIEESGLEIISYNQFQNGGFFLNKKGEKDVTLETLPKRFTKNTIPNLTYSYANYNQVVDTFTADFIESIKQIRESDSVDELFEIQEEKINESYMYDEEGRKIGLTNEALNDALLEQILTTTLINKAKKIAEEKNLCDLN